MTTFAQRAESLFGLWLSTVVRDETGTRAGELYTGFAQFADRVALQADEIPTSAAFGRRLSAEGFAPIHRADGNWRPLRPLAVTDPAPAFSQVNPSESLEFADSVAGSPENPVVAHSGSHARVHTHVTHAQPPISESTEIPPPTLQPATVTHPSNPAWAKRWQARLDATPTPQDRATEARNMLLAATKRTERTPAEVEAIFDKLADFIVECANETWQDPPPARSDLPPHPPRPTPTSVPIFEELESGRRGKFLFFLDSEADE